MIRSTETSEPRDVQPQEPQLLLPRMPLTTAHKALITMLAEIAVEQYLAEEEGK